ncbi:MAG: hypothetical protein RRC34_12680 [Lentisphaeria bacterium]|nr:hypothetical protein [Lentisphaeria bacterium]
MAKRTHYHTRAKRFTLVELLFASAIALFVIGGMITFSLYSLQALKRLQTDADMRLEGAQAVERFKSDLAFTASGKIVLAPDETSAAAISFPILWRDTHTTTPVVGEEIDWTHTVIYHLRTNADGTQDICRTIFSNRDNAVTEASRLTQANRVLTDGHGANALNGANASTSVLVENITDLVIGKGDKTINARAENEEPILKRIGYARVSSGSHTFRFETADDDATPQNIGIDTLYLTPAGGAIDGEIMINTLTTNGGTASVTSPVPSYKWANNAQLLFTTSSPKAFVEFNVHNDMWVESEFAQTNAVTLGTKVTVATDTGEEALTLAGMEDAWIVEQQVDAALPPALISDSIVTTDTAGVTTTTEVPVDFSGKEVQIILLGDANINDGGAGKLCKIRLRGVGGKTPQLDSDGNPVLDADSGEVMLLDADTIIESALLDDVQVTFNGGESGVTVGAGATVESDWIELAYDPKTTYKLSLTLAAESAEYYVAPYMIGGQTGIRVKGVDYPQCPLIAGIFVSYPESGTYTSRVFDTKLKLPDYGTVYGLMSDTSGGKSISVKVRSANNPDMNDASGWTTVSATTLTASPAALSGVATKRYVQFEVTLGTVAPYQDTPVLRSMVITWPGPDKIVDLSGVFTHGPRYGKFVIYMDDMPLNTVNAHMSFNVIREIRGETISKPFYISTGSHQIEGEWTL